MSNPNHIVPISPEGYEIATTYLQTQSIEETAQELGIDTIQVTQFLEKSEVKNYINEMYISSGFRSRFKLAEVMDSLIEQKLSELNEAEIGSSKDILEILQFAHKMRIDEINAMAKLESVRKESPKQQTNIQINANPYADSNYGKLLDSLLSEDKVSTVVNT